MLVLIALVIAVNLIPENPYYVDAISAWRQGKLANFNALAHWLSLLWPFALAFGLATLFPYTTLFRSDRKSVV